MAELQFARACLDDAVDLRTKVVQRTNAVLEAHARARDCDKAEVIREVLDKWAEAEIHVATLIQRMTRSEGGMVEASGKPGNHSD